MLWRVFRVRQMAWERFGRPSTCRINWPWQLLLDRTHLWGKLIEWRGRMTRKRSRSNHHHWLFIGSRPPQRFQEIARSLMTGTPSGKGSDAPARLVINTRTRLETQSRKTMPELGDALAGPGSAAQRLQPPGELLASPCESESVTGRKIDRSNPLGEQ